MSAQGNMGADGEWFKPRLEEIEVLGKSNVEVRKDEEKLARGWRQENPSPEELRQSMGSYRNEVVQYEYSTGWIKMDAKDSARRIQI